MTGVLLALFAAGFVILAVVRSARNDMKNRKQTAAKGRPILLDTGLVEAAEHDTKPMGRSAAEQIERWAHIGRVWDLRPDFDYENVSEALRGNISPDRLSSIERALYDAEFGERMKYAGGGEG